MSVTGGVCEKGNKQVFGPARVSSVSPFCNISSVSFFKFIFIFGCTGSSWLCKGFSLVVASGGLL